MAAVPFPLMSGLHGEKIGCSLVFHPLREPQQDSVVQISHPGMIRRPGGNNTGKMSSNVANMSGGFQPFSPALASLYTPSHSSLKVSHLNRLLSRGKNLRKLPNLRRPGFQMGRVQQTFRWKLSETFGEHHHHKGAVNTCTQTGSHKKSSRIDLQICT